MYKRSRETIDDDEHEEDGSVHRKKTRIVKTFHDPMEVLPKKCKFEVLNYFKGKELILLTEVSKTWKKEIESNPMLMNRAINNVKLKVKDEFLKDDIQILTNNKRQYKHLELTDCFEEEDCIIKKLIRSLETLTIKDTANFFRTEMEGYVFPKLLKLCIDHYDDSWFRWLLKCRFPKLNELRYVNTFSRRFSPKYYQWLDTLGEILTDQMGDITHLYMRVIKIQDIDNMESVFELESADFGRKFPKSLIYESCCTLTVLHAGCTLKHLSFILENCENLKTLAIDIITDDRDYKDSEEDSDDDCQIISDSPIDEIMLQYHEELETLKIQTETPKVMLKVLRALPNLITLVTYNFFTKTDINILGEII